jgi:monoamine oxidase
MSVTRQEPVPAGMAQAQESGAVLGETSHYDRENPPSAGPAVAPLQQMMDDRLLERSKDEAGGLRLTGEGSMPGELVKAVPERALDAELTAHLRYERACGRRPPHGPSDGAASRLPPPTRPFSRRSLLRGGVLAGLGAAGLAGASGCGSSSGSSSYTRRVDVVVVGAGLAGLVAALELTRSGLSSVVLEARDRVGGRMLRKQVIEGGWVDLGGQWVGPTQSAILAVAKELHVEHFDSYYTGNNVLYYDGMRSAFEGEFPPSASSGQTMAGVSRADLVAAQQVWAKIDTLASTVNTAKPWLTPDASSLDSQTVSQWLTQNTTSDFASFSVRFYTLNEQSADPDQVSMLYILFQLASGPPDEEPEKWLFHGAAGQIPPMLAAQLGDRVVLNQPVYQIDQDSSGVTVTTTGGRYRANEAIVAIPPYLAGGIIYNPAMPAVRSALTQHEPMGTTIKYHAVYPNAWWRRKGLSGGAVSQLPTLLTADSSPPSGVPGILTAFIIGTAAVAVETKPAAARRQLVLSNLATYFGPRAMSPSQFIEFNWPAQKWTGGAYNAYLGPDVLTDYWQAATAPAGRIHWAGTETADQWNGFFDGAVTSAQRAVEEVMARS